MRVNPRPKYSRKVQQQQRPNSVMLSIGSGGSGEAICARVRSSRRPLTDNASARYAVQVLGQDQTDPPRTWDDHELVDAFLYGDLVHADDRHQGDAAAANLRERYRAAFGLLADLVALLWRTLGLIWLCRRTLDLSDWAWTT